MKEVNVHCSVLWSLVCVSCWLSTNVLRQGMQVLNIVMICELRQTYLSREANCRTMKETVTYSFSELVADG